MPSTSPLRDWLRVIGAEFRGGEWLAPCPLYADAHRLGADPYKVVIGRGAKRAVLVHCRVCGAAAIGRLLAAWGVDGDVLEAWAKRDGHWEHGPAAAVEYDWALLHRAYSELLRLCPLTDEHRTWLRRRGVSDALADHCGYGSFAGGENWQHETWWNVGTQYGTANVPGLYAASDIRGPGIAIPCRGEDGRIRAIKVRLTDGGRSRMRLLSSRASGGLPAVSTLHFPLGDARERTRSSGCWITEGERKADVLAASPWAAGEQVVAVPGVGGVDTAVEWAVRSRREPITLAFDRDAAGDAATATAARLLRQRGFAGPVTRCLWEGAAKGCDDAIAAGSPLRFEDVSAEANGGPPHRPASATVADLHAALGRTVWPVEAVRRQFPHLRRTLDAAVRGGEVAFQKVRGVGGCVAIPELTEAEWQEWTAQSNSAASATPGAGGPAIG